MRTPSRAGRAGPLTAPAETAAAAQTMEMRERGARAEAAMNAAVAAEQTWVHGRVIGAYWKSVHGTPPPAGVSARWSRVFEQAVIAGRVIVRRAGRHLYYVPSSQQRLPVPAQGSDLERVETALARAVARYSGAVPASAIEDEIANDSTLALTTASSVATRLSTLEQCGRARGVRPRRLQHDGPRRVYYTTITGPARVARAREFKIDAQVRAVRALWKASGGRPFSTRVLAQFVKQRPHLGADDVSSRQWAGAVKQLERAGLLLRVNDVDREDPFFCRWVLRAEWELLPSEEQDRRARDPYGRDDGPALARRSNASAPPRSGSRKTAPDAGVTIQSAGPNEAHHQAIASDAPRVDASFISRNRNARVLVELAQGRIANAAENAEDRQVLRNRPVSADDVRPVLETHGHLLPARTPLTRALSDASRVRAEMKRAAVTHVGCVLNVTYYALEESAVARNYVEYRKALGAIDLRRLRQATNAVQAATEFSASGLLPIAAEVLAARLALLRSEIDDLGQRLGAAARTVPRLAHEVASDRDIAAELEQCRSCADALSRRLPPDVLRNVPYPEWRLPQEALISIADAYAQVEEMSDHRVRRPHAFGSKLHSVRLVRDDGDIARDDAVDAVDRAAPPADIERLESHGPGTRGRRAKNYLDRVALSAYACLRWGGPMSAAWAAQAVHALGELRCAEPLARVLRRPTAMVARASTAAALGLLDTASGRAALADYITGADAQRAEPGAIVMACFGLAPRAIGRTVAELSERERDALETALRFGDPLARSTAARALQAWNERWDRRALLSV